MNEPDDIVKEFLVKSYENLDRLDRELIGLQKHPSNRDTRQLTKSESGASLMTWLLFAGS